MTESAKWGRFSENDSELFKEEKNRHDSKYIYDDVITPEDVEHDSDSDIPDPCMECGQKFDEYEDVHGHRILDYLCFFITLS